MKIGIDLGGSHIAIGVVDENGTIIDKTERRILKEDKNNIISIIEEYVSYNVSKFASQYEITSIGIAIPGTVNEKYIIKSVNLGIENYNIVDRLQEILFSNDRLGKNIEKEIDIENNQSQNAFADKKRIDIKIKNDAKCAALAENKFGSMKEYKRSLFLTLGTGIGGAVIINNELLDTGSLPGAEVGHMVIQKDGIECNCGKKGCFEKYASMKAFKNNLRNALNLDETTRGQELLQIISLVKNKFEIENRVQLENCIVDNKLQEIIEKEENVEKINKVIQEFIENLSIGISNLVNIFEPEAIVIGGSFVYYKDVLLEKLEQELLNGQYLFNKRDKIIIKPALLGNDAGIIGACCF